MENIIKINKKKLNNIIHELLQENKKYGVIVTYAYTYAKTIKDITLIKKGDINFSENTITINGKKYPLNNYLKNIIEEYYNGVKSKHDYLFISRASETRNIKNKINYQLYKFKDKANVKLTSKDFKILRGQHLLIDGVPIKIIHELMDNTNIEVTKKTLKFHEIMDCIGCNTINDIITHFTDLEICCEDDIDINPIFIVTKDNDSNSKGIVVELDEDTLDIVEYEGKQIKVNDELKALLNKLNLGDYVRYCGYKWLRQ